MDPEVNERFKRIEGIVDGLVNVVSGLVTIVAEHEKDRAAMREEWAVFRQGMEELRQAQKHTDENLGVLIRMMDEWIRSNPRNGAGAAPPPTA